MAIKLTKKLKEFSGAGNVGGYHMGGIPVTLQKSSNMRKEGNKKNKYYIYKNLNPKDTDNLLEVGSGIGRLTEFFGHYVRNVYGIDIIDKFVDDCNLYKSPNTHYLKMNEIDVIRKLNINKLVYVS